MRRSIFAAALAALLLWSGAAGAQTTGSLAVTDANRNAQQIGVVVDGGGVYHYDQTLQYVAAGEPTFVSATDPLPTSIIQGGFTATVNSSGQLVVDCAAGCSGGGGGGGAVYGPTAVGSANANPPVVLGGTANGTSTGNVEVAKVDSAGNVYADVTNTVAVTQSGTWTVGLSAGSATIGAISNTSFAATQSGSWSFACSSGCYQSTQPVSLASLPALATGSNTIGAVAQASGPWTQNLTQWDSTALGAPSTYGTAPSGTVPGVNAYVTNTPAVTCSACATAANQTDVTAAAGTATSDALAAQGPTATSSAYAANPLPDGGEALSAEPSAATTGHPVAAFRDLAGKDVTSPYANRENYVRGSASETGTSAGTLIAAAGSGIKTYVTDVECGRTDAGTTAIYVTFSDTASTIMVLPNLGGGGGNSKTFNVPLATAANTAFTFTASASVSTVYCSAQGYTGY